MAFINYDFRLFPIVQVSIDFSKYSKENLLKGIEEIKESIAMGGKRVVMLDISNVSMIDVDSRLAFSALFNEATAFYKNYVVAMIIVRRKLIEEIAIESVFNFGRPETEIIYVKTGDEALEVAQRLVKENKIPSNKFIHTKKGG